MKVYLVQHAEAKSEEEDSAKHLTEKGLQDAAKLGECLARSGVRPAEIWHSGKKRAEQTASTIASRFSEEIPVLDKPGMAPKDVPAPLVEELKDGVMIVGHMPFMGKMAARLITHHEKAQVVNFGYGRCLCLNRGGKHWSIEWMLDPDLL